MRWKEVIDKFISKQYGSGSNCMSTGEKLYSYNTCIGQWVGNVVYINTTKYSNTTTKLQNYLLYKTINYNLGVEILDNVFKNQSFLYG